MSVVERLGFRVSHLGEWLGVDSLTYNAVVMGSFDRYARRNAPGFSQRLYALFGSVRYLDVGAGTGRYVDCLRALGAPSDACEHSSAARRLAARRGTLIAPFDLSVNPPVTPAGESYDIAFSLEVAEHLPPALGERLVDVLCRTPTIVFTAAHPGQGGTGHINEQPRAYWETLFQAHGFDSARELEQRFHVAPGDIPDSFLLENLMIFTRRS